MEKKFSSIRAFVDVGGNTKPCVICGNTATQEAIFTVEGATIIEKYCDSCAKKGIIRDQEFDWHVLPQTLIVMVTFIVI